VDDLNEFTRNSTLWQTNQVTQSPSVRCKLRYQHRGEENTHEDHLSLRIQQYEDSKDWVGGTVNEGRGLVMKWSRRPGWTYIDAKPPGGTEGYRAYTGCTVWQKGIRKSEWSQRIFVMDGLITMVCGWERKEWNRLLHQESPRRGILEISKIRSFGHQWETEGFDFSGHEHSKTIHRCYTSRSEYDLSMICWFVWSKLINVDQCRYFIKPSFIVSD